jgi:tRNA(fMet)-specific endonuclease VapC
MAFMLDANTCVDLIRQRNEKVFRRLKQRQPDELCVSSVTLSELEYGAARSSDPARNRLALAEFMTPLRVMPYDDMAAAAYGPLRAELERKGLPIGPLDTLIAAHALSLGMTLVTDNEREFARVAGLRVQNWAR